jgi:hypothetical protein
LNEFTEFIVLSSYKFELLTSKINEIMLLPENKRDKTLEITLILDICYELYDNYLNYEPSDTKRHIFYLLFTTELVRDFECYLSYLIPNETEKIKIFEKFVNREDFEKENILKHILEYLNR